MARIDNEVTVKRLKRWGKRDWSCRPRTTQWHRSRLILPSVILRLKLAVVIRPAAFTNHCGGNRAPFAALTADAAVRA